jgi:integrase
MIAPAKPFSQRPEPEGLWSDYCAQYLDRLKFESPRHYLTGKDILDRFTRIVAAMWVKQQQEELGIKVWPEDMRVVDVTFRLYQAFIAIRCESPGRKSPKLSKATLNKEIAYLNTVFRYAQQPTEQDYDWFGAAPPGWKPPRMKRFRQPKRKPKAIELTLLERVFAAAKHATTPNLPGIDNATWWQTFYCVGLVTGLRREALLSVPRPSEKDLDAGILRVPAECDKESEDREFHLPAEVVAMIRRLPISADGRLFAWPFGVRHFYRSLEKWQVAGGIAKDEKALPHGLRRTKGTLLTRAGHNLALVADEMSHASIETTRKHYIGTLTDERAVAVEQLFRSLPVPDELRKQRLAKLAGVRELPFES